MRTRRRDNFHGGVRFDGSAYTARVASDDAEGTVGGEEDFDGDGFVAERFGVAFGALCQDFGSGGGEGDGDGSFVAGVSDSL